MSKKTKNWYNTYYSKKEGFIEKSWYAGARELIRRNFTSIETITLLEIGCGSGEFISSAQGGMVAGYDISFEAAKSAKKYSEGAHIFNCSGESIGIKNDSLDLVVMCEVIEHVENPDKVLDEIFRVLSPGGKLIISFPNYLNALYMAILIFGWLLNKPNWLDRQVVDRTVFYPQMLDRLKKHGFVKEDVIGKTYGHLKIPGIRWIEKLEKLFNACKLHFLSFHPVILLKKVG